MVDVAAKFTEAEICPKIITNPPKGPLDVNFSGHPLEFGNELAANDVRFAPRIHFPSDPECIYALAMIDPDNLSRKNPCVAEWLHWLVVNIPASNLRDGMIGGQVAMAYGSPGPQPRTGPHRYVILLYQQPTTRVKQNTVQQRGKFNVKSWAEKLNLGDPVGGNFFIVENKMG